MRLNGVSIRLRPMLDQCFPYSRISSNAIKRFKLHTTNIEGEEVVTVVIKTKTPPRTNIRGVVRVNHCLFITTPKRPLPASVVKHFPMSCSVQICIKPSSRSDWFLVKKKASQRPITPCSVGYYPGLTLNNPIISIRYFRPKVCRLCFFFMLHSYKVDSNVPVNNRNPRK